MVWVWACHINGMGWAYHDLEFGLFGTLWFPLFVERTVMSSSGEQPAPLPVPSRHVEGRGFSSSRESSGSLRHDKGTGVSRAHRYGRRPAPWRSAGNSHVNKRVWPDVLARPRTSASPAPVSEPSLRQVLEELAVLRGEVAELCASAPPGPEHDGEVRPGPSGIPP